MTRSRSSSRVAGERTHRPRVSAGDVVSALPQPANVDQNTVNDPSTERDTPTVATTSASPSRLADLPAWMLIGLLIFAPWVYGCTRPWSLALFNYLAFATLGTWLVTSIVTRSRPRVQPMLAGLIIGLLVLGWWMTWNAGFSYDAKYQPHERTNFSHSWPGAVDFAVALPAMTGLSAILGLTAMASHFGRHRAWRLRLWRTMALTGVSVVLLGLAQKVTSAPGIFWQSEGFTPTFFGPYRYHANAGAFMNLVWPLVGGFLVYSMQRGASLRERIFWAGCLVISVAGALANSSRASGLIAVTLIGCGMVWLACYFIKRKAGRTEMAMAFGVVLSLAALVLVVVACGGLDVTMSRWGMVEQELKPTNSRLMVAKVCLDMLPTSGWFGFGPGTFRTAFPFFNHDTTIATYGIWFFAHEDYLQTLVEWGWIGSALWALIPLGAFGSAAPILARTTKRVSSRDRYLGFASIAGLAAVFIHALGDFPLQVASIQLYCGVLVGLLWTSRGWRTESTGPHGGTSSSRPAALETTDVQRTNQPVVVEVEFNAALGDLPIREQAA